MKMYIPQLGDQIKLLADWTFDLFDEDRNATLIEKFGIQFPQKSRIYWREKAECRPATIPAGAILKIDRIFIRKGAEDYDSITFFWEGESVPAKIENRVSHAYTGVTGEVPIEHKYTRKVPKKNIRFWAKMADVNNIEFERVL